MIEIRNLELGPYESESTTTVGQEKNESFAFGIDKDNPDVRFINDSFGVKSWKNGNKEISYSCIYELRGRNFSKERRM